MFHPHSIPAHCVLMQNGPYVNLGCDPCQQNPSRLMESIDNIRLKRLVDLGSLPDCTCRDRPLVHVPPPSKFYNLLDSPATFSYCRLPPALPILMGEAMQESLAGKPLIPGEAPRSMLPSEAAASSQSSTSQNVPDSTTTALRLLLLAENVIPADDFYSYYFSMQAVRHTQNALNGALESISNHSSCSEAVPGVAAPIRRHCTNLVRLLRDYIVPMDQIHESIRAHAPPTWWESKVFKCWTMAPFDRTLHNIVASCRLSVLDLPFLLGYVDKHFTLTTQQEIALVGYLHYSKQSPRGLLNSPHTRFIYALVTHLLQVTDTLTGFAAVSTRRFYLSSSLLFSYKFCRNMNLLDQYKLFYAELDPGGALHKLCLPPEVLARQRRYLAPLPLTRLEERYQTLVKERSSWGFPAVPKLRYFAELSRFFPGLEFSLDVWRKVLSESFHDTCSVHCAASCICLPTSVENQVRRRQISSHLPAGWPCMEFDPTLLYEMPDGGPQVLTPCHTSTPVPSPTTPCPQRSLAPPLLPSSSSHLRSFSPPPSPIPNLRPHHPGSPGSLPGSPTRSRRNPPLPAPRRLRSSTSTLFLLLVFLFFPLAFAQQSVVNKGDFVFSTVSERVLVNPSRHFFARKLDMKGLTATLEKMQDVYSTYQNICLKALQSPGMEPTYMLLTAPLLSYDIDATCRTKGYLPPTVESARDRTSLEELLISHGIEKFASPYVAAGPGALSNRILLKSTDGYVPTIPVLAIDESSSAIKAIYPSLFRLGPMNRLRLSFLSGALNMTSMTSPSAVAPRHLICRNPSAYRIRPGDKKSFPIVEKLCNAEVEKLTNHISEVRKILTLVDPSFITELEFNTSSHMPSFPFVSPPGPSTMGAGPPKKPLLDDTADFSLAAWTKRLAPDINGAARQERAAAAVVLGVAAAAILLANTVASVRNIAELEKTNDRLDQLAAGMSAVQIMSQEMRDALERVAAHQMEISETVQNLNSEMLASIFLLKLNDDFSILSSNLHFAINNLLAIVTAARRNVAHEFVVSSEFLLEAQKAAGDDKLVLDPKHIRTSLVRNNEALFILLEFPTFQNRHLGTLLRLDPLPIFREGKSYLPKTVPRHIVVLAQEDRYIILDESETSACERRPFDCRTSGPLVPPTVPACGPPNYFNRASTCVYSPQEYTTDYFRSFGNLTIYRVPGKRTLHRHCFGEKSSRTTYSVVGTGTFSIPPHCTITTVHGFKLFGNTQTSPEIHLSTVIHLGIADHPLINLETLDFPDLDLQKNEFLLEDIKNIALPDFLLPSTTSIIEVFGGCVVIMLFLFYIMYLLLLRKVRQYVHSRINIYLRGLEMSRRADDFELAALHSPRRALSRRPRPPTPPQPTLPPPPPPPLSPTLLASIRQLRAQRLTPAPSPQSRRHQSTTALTALEDMMLPSPRPLTPSAADM